jgi:hypothetical protein
MKYKRPLVCHSGTIFRHAFSHLLKQKQQYDTHSIVTMEAVNTVLPCFDKLMQAEVDQAVNQ